MCFSLTLLQLTILILFHLGAPCSFVILGKLGDFDHLGRCVLTGDLCIDTVGATQGGSSFYGCSHVFAQQALLLQVDALALYLLN